MLEYQKKYESYKFTVNFLHDHLRETYFYQKYDYLKALMEKVESELDQNFKDAYMLAINNIRLPHPNAFIQQ